MTKSEKIKELRLAQGLTLKQLGAKCLTKAGRHLSKQQIWAIENPETQKYPIKDSTYKMVFAALGVTLKTVIE